jgi:hypothetical protein
MGRTLTGAIAAVALLCAPAAAQGPLGPLNDLAALGQGAGQTPDAVPTMTRAEPPFEATPRAKCLKGSKPEPSIQGRVPAGSDINGLWCNVKLIGHQGSSGGFKVWRYVDTAGHECAIYDTALVYPLNAFKFDSSSQGVVVLDMSNPRKPVQTAVLTDVASLTPHESVDVNQKRGLLAEVSGNLATEPGYVSIYDLHKDCRHPVMDAGGLFARLGHESGFSTDGKTFYASATGYHSIVALDLTDPKSPHAVWEGNLRSHGLSLSPDGNRAYLTEPLDHYMLILDTSEIQARKPNPQAHEIARLAWSHGSLPQNAMPFTQHGKPYVLEFDEFNGATLALGSPDDIGAARIIDVSDERAPKVIANLRLQVNQPTEHAKYSNDDPGSFSPGQGYAAHYCNLDSRTNAKVVACSFIVSGLRVFDISNVRKPKEIAYYVAPAKAAAENGGDGSNYAMSKPAFAPKRHEVWYTDTTSGFYALRVDKRVWPK